MKALNYILFGILLLVLLFYIVITISQPRYAVTNILLYVIPTIIGIYFGVKVIKREQYKHPVYEVIHNSLFNLI